VKNITSTYDDENRLTTVGGITFTYDANGNITNASGTETYTNTFDYNDKLINTTMSGITTQYGYDGTGNRLSKTVNSVTTRYVIDVNRSLPTVIAETDSANTITAFYVHGNGLISKVLPDTTTYCYHYDSRGSTIALTDATQTVTDAYAYDTFGNINTKSGSTANPFSYLGRYGIIDDGNGLYNIRARYYDPDTGRFITKDPLTGKDSDTQSLNRYVYALNNPIRLIDVSGFSAGEGGAGQNNFETSDELHRAIVDRRIRMAKLNSLKAQYDYVAALETEAAYWDATVNTLEGVYGALNTVGGLLTGSGSSVASGLVTMGGAFSQAAGMDQGWHTAANLVSTGLDVYGLSSSANKFYKALDGRTAQAAALGLDIATDLTGNVTKTATEAVKMGGGVISTVKGYGVMLWENLF
jgi:RHS repeat-associated protein